MTLKTAVKIVEEHQKWRRGHAPYDGDIPAQMPHTPKEIGIAIDCLLSISRDILRNYEANR
jgi:hypothetical protein